MGRPAPTCEKCGSLLSIVTWTCVRGAHCRPETPSPAETERGSVVGRQAVQGIGHANGTPSPKPHEDRADG